jgi:hypothetical protein
MTSNSSTKPAKFDCSAVKLKTNLILFVKAVCSAWSCATYLAIASPLLLKITF